MDVPQYQILEISIHALLAESDGIIDIINNIINNFYPRSPCGERRKSNKLAGLELVFLSTLSLRRATTMTTTICIALKFLSTLSLRRATAKVHKTVEHFCAYETNFMEIASSC